MIIKKEKQEKQEKENPILFKIWDLLTYGSFLTDCSFLVYLYSGYTFFK